VSNRLADLRSTITDLEGAKRALGVLAGIECGLASADARFERRVHVLKTQHEERTAEERALAQSIRGQLAAYIDANKGLFAKPKKVKTEHGEFGLRTVTDLVVTDETALLEALLQLGYDDCYQVARKPLKTPIKERLKAEEQIPGCTLRTGDTAVYSVSKALIEEARETALSSS